MDPVAPVLSLAWLNKLIACSSQPATWEPKCRASSPCIEGAVGSAYALGNWSPITPSTLNQWAGGGNRRLRVSSSPISLRARSGTSAVSWRLGVGTQPEGPAGSHPWNSCPHPEGNLCGTGLHVATSVVLRSAQYAKAIPTLVLWKW